MPRPSRPCPRDALSGGSGSIAQPPPLPLAQADGGRQAAADTDGTYSYAPWPWCTLRLYRGTAVRPCRRPMHSLCAPACSSRQPVPTSSCRQRTRPHSRSDPPIRRDEALALGRSDACCEATRHIFLDGSLLPSWCVYERIVLRNCVRRLKWFPLTVFSY
jgi:hypothetical protein